MESDTLRRDTGAAMSEENVEIEALRSADARGRFA
jgi:hypothetical protein